MSQRTGTAPLRFDALPETIGASLIVRLPGDISRRLPSRGQVAVSGSINGCGLRTVVEPDGVKGHWLRIDAVLHAGVEDGASVDVVLEVAPEWPEPDLPHDLSAALAAAPPDVQQIWADITPMARWEWVRWVNATANLETRRRRVDVSMSKLGGGKRRPCCFDLSACTDPTVSRNGRLRGAS